MTLSPARQPDGAADAVYQELFDLAPDGLIEVDERGTVTRANRRAANQLGMRPAELLGLSLLPFVDPPCHPAVKRAGRHVARSGEHTTIRVDVRPRHAGPFTASVTVGRSQWEPGHTRLLLSVHDLTEQRRVEETLEHRANHDPLTGLLNRAHFVRELDRALECAEHRPSSVVLLFVDLDRFKVLNDRLGHRAGDEILTLAARRIRSVSSDGDFCGRIGGDEFAVTLVGIGSELDAMRRASQLRNAISQPFALESGHIATTATVGVALGEPGATAETLLRGADHAMYVGKRQGRDRAVFYDEVLRGEVVRRSRLEAELPRAIREGHLRVRYQPQVELATGRMHGVEALIRWRHPELGLIPACDFVPIAENMNLINLIDHGVLRKACDDGSRWPDGPVVSVNMSAIELTANDLVARVMFALSGTGLPADRLCIEITESAAIGTTAATIDVLHELRAWGVGIAIDDFGTGYSSLGYLRDLPITVLKIDQSFVRGITTNRHDRLIAVATIQMAAALGLRTVAEGVETEAQRDELAKAGCDDIQGHLVGRPVTRHDIARLVSRSADGSGADPPRAFIYPHG